MKEHKSIKIAAGCLILAGCLMLFISCLSFDIGDWPSDYVSPHNNPSQNWCGSVGAFLAYYSLYYVGPGVFVILTAAITFGIAKLIGQNINQFWLRICGLTLLAVAFSSSYYCFWPELKFSFPHGSGGILGVAAILYLQSHFALLGTFILLMAAWFVGLILVADVVVMAMLRYFGHGCIKAAALIAPAWVGAWQKRRAVSKLWQKLSLRRLWPSFSTKSENLTDDNERSVKLHLDRDVAMENHLAGEQESQDTNEDEYEYVDETDDGEYEEAVIEIAETNPAGKSRRLTSPMPVTNDYKDYIFPSMDLLTEPEYDYAVGQEKVVRAKADALENLLKEFNINANVVSSDSGPVVTMFELELGAGVKVSQISSLANDIARALSAGAVRVVAPLPGRHTIGIEVPNSRKETVRIKDIMKSSGDKPSKMQIPLFLGKDSSGAGLISDLAAMPHMLIAGTTGSGKSVCINSIIMSILLTRRPNEVKLILVDPKMVEMTAFSNVPHLMAPIVTETQRAVQILSWATVKMDERYALLAEARVKNIAEYNKLSVDEIYERFSPGSEDEKAQIPKRIPYIVIVIDELADLMMTAAKDIEGYIVRLAQKSRAVGIHLVLATQRPQATVVTGLIKSNMPVRIGFRVAARMDSRIILDQNGAETLLGQGDMLFLKPGTSDLIRAQGAFVDDIEVRRVIKHLKDVAEPSYHPELLQLGKTDMSTIPQDELFDKAVEIVLTSKRGSVSLLQRKLAVGYARASRMIETMATSGILGEYKGSQAREVLMTAAEYKNARRQIAMDAANGYEYAQDDQTGDSKSDSLDCPNEGQLEYAAIEDEDDDK